MAETPQNDVPTLLLLLAPKMELENILVVQINFNQDDTPRDRELLNLRRESRVWEMRERLGALIVR